MGRQKKNEQGLSVTKKPNGIYHYWFKIDKPYSSSCKTRDESEAWMYANAVYKKVSDEASDADGVSITLDELCELFRESAEETMLYESYKNYRTMTNLVRGFKLNHITKAKIALDNPLVEPATKIHKITDADFKQYFKKHHLKSASLRLHFVRIGKMMSWAKENGYAVPDVNWKKFNKEIPDSHQKTLKYSNQQAIAIIKQLKDSKNPINAHIFRIIICMGFRIGEVVSIQRKNIDFETGLIRVKRLKKKAGAQVWDEVQMPDNVWNALIDLDNSLPAEQIYLFAGKTPDTHKKAGCEWLSVALDKLGYNKADQERYTSHTGRATFITTLIESDVSDFKIMKAVRHSSPTVTAGYNRMTTNAASKDAAKIMTKKFDI